MIKERIKNKIDNSDDLELIDDLFEDNNTTSIQLTQQEKDALQVSINQLKNNKTISNEIVQKEIDKWLTK